MNKTGSEPPEPHREDQEPVPYILPGSDTPPEPQKGEPGYSPYGLAGASVGDAAVDLRDRIAAPSEQTALPSHPPIWDEADEMALGFFLDVEEHLPTFDGELGEPATTRFPELAHFHAALPFTDAEREWLVAKSSALWEVEPKDMLAIHNGTFSMEQKITELGAQQGVAGADMIRRWAAWRRNADEFAENSTREDAAYALDRLIHQLYPYDPYPYED